MNGEVMKKRRFFFAGFLLSIVASIFCAKKIAFASAVATYYDQQLGQEKTVTDFSQITSPQTSLTTGWYLVSGDIEYLSGNNLTISGTVNMIMADGSTLKMANDNSIILSSGATLNIYPQTKNQGGDITIVTPGETAYSGIHVPVGATLNLHGGSIQANGGSSGNTAIGGGSNGAVGGTFNIYYGNVSTYGASGCAINMTKTTIYKGYLAADNGMGDSTSAFAGDLEVKGGEVVVTYYPISGGYAFAKQPTIAKGLRVTAGDSSSDASRFKQSAIIESTFTRNRYVNIKNCIEHSGTGDVCEYCGFNYITELTITGIDAPIAGMPLDTTAVCTNAGVLTTSPTVKWTSDSESSPTIAKPGISYKAEVTIKLDEDTGVADDDHLTATINGKEAIVFYNIYDCSVMIRFAAVEKHTINLNFKDYSTSLSYGDKVSPIKVTPSIAGWKSSYGDEPDYSDAKITYTSSDESVAKVNSTTGAVSIVGLGNFYVTAAIEEGEINKSADKMTDTITVGMKDLSDIAEVEFVNGSEMPYSGMEWSPQFKISYGDIELKPEEYNVATPEDMVGVGKKEIYIYYLGNYSGYSKIEGYIINARGVSINTVSDDISGMTRKENSGKAIQTDLDGDMKTVIYHAKEGYYFPKNYVDSVEYYITKTDDYKSTTAKGCGVEVRWVDYDTIEIKGKPKYLTTVSLPKASLKKDWSVSLDGLKNSYTFGTKNVSASVISEKDKGYEVEYKSSDSTVAKIGKETGAITFVGVGSFKVTATVLANSSHNQMVLESEMINVTALDLSTKAKVEFVDSNEYEYDGNEWKPEFKVTYGKKILSEDTDYSVTYPEDMKTDGDKVFTITFKGNYSGNYVITGKITKKEEPEEPKFEMPERPFTIQGTMGKNNYYITTVQIVPAEGYRIRENETDEFTESLSYTESFAAKQIYLYEVANQTVSEAITLPDLNIDIYAPFFGGVRNQDSIYNDDYHLSITDANLATVKLNDEIKSCSGRFLSLPLVANDGFEKYTVFAEDMAGNQSEITVTVYATWMEKGEIPDQVPITLKNNYQYHLGSGVWNVQGDKTQYNGNMDIYVGSESKYTFKKVN